VNREERVLKIFKREEVDYQPSQFHFSWKFRIKDDLDKLGLKDNSQLDDFVDNHFLFVRLGDENPIPYCNYDKELKTLEKNGFCKVDYKENVVYDNWGMGIKRGMEGLHPHFHPLSGNVKPEIKKFLPENLVKSIYSNDLEQAVEHYRAPDINREGNFDAIRDAIISNNGEKIIVPSGYFGIFERAFGLLGLEKLLIELALRPKTIEKLLDKITDYKIEYAKKVIKLGAKIAHHGDDMGTQTGTLISKEMFRRLIKPKIASLFSVYKDAGLPIFMHSCGNIIDFIPDLIEIGLDGLEPIQPCMDLKYLKKEFGKDLVFWGGIDSQQVLPYGSTDEVRKNVSGAIKTLGKDDGYIIGASQHILSNVPTENIGALLEIVNESKGLK